MTINHKFNLLLPWQLRTILVLLALLQPQVVLAASSPICFSDVTIRPGSALDFPPTIDGDVQHDNGWLNAWRNVFHNGTPSHNAVIQGIKDSANIYLSFEVNNDDALNLDDEIILTIDPNPASGSAMRTYIRIYPVVPGYNPAIPGSGIANPMVIEWSQKATGTGWTPVHMPVNSDVGANGRAVAAMVSDSSSNYSWSVELKLPMAVFGIPPAGEFAMYINLLPNKAGVVTPYPFPAVSPTLSGDDTNTPPMASWGTAKTNATSCSGVYIEVADIYTDNSPSNAIDTRITDPITGQLIVNRFHAIVHNTSIDNAGNPVTANNVKATFSVAQFGLGNAWKTIPTNGGTAPNNPTLEASIAGNSTRDFTLDWTLSAAERTDYSPPRDHQCILVDLESNRGTCVEGTNANAACVDNTSCSGGGVCQPTIFSVRSMYHNMNFAALSKFTSKPEINTRGWKKPPSGQNQLVELMVTKKVDTLNRDLVRQWLSGEKRVKSSGGESMKEFSNWPAARDKNYDAFVSQLANTDVQVSQLTYLVHGCRRSGKLIKIHSNEYEICDDVGSFGYVLRHAGIGEPKWDVAMDGPRLTKIEGATEHYQMSLEKEKTAQMTASFSAESVVTPICIPTPCQPCPNIKIGSSDGSGLPGALVLIGCIGGLGGIVFRKRRKDEKGQVE